MKRHRIFIGLDNNTMDEVGSLVANFVPKASVVPCTGIWNSKVEPAACVEIIELETMDSTLLDKAIHDFATKAKIDFRQDAVLYVCDEVPAQLL